MAEERLDQSGIRNCYVYSVCFVMSSFCKDILPFANISSTIVKRKGYLPFFCCWRNPDCWFICSYLLHSYLVLQKLIYSRYHFLITSEKSYCFLIMFFQLSSEQGIFSVKVSKFFSGGCTLCSMWLYTVSKFAKAI